LNSVCHLAVKGERMNEMAVIRDVCFYYYSNIKRENERNTGYERELC